MAVTSLWSGRCSSRREAALASLEGLCPFAGREPAAQLCAVSCGICTKRCTLIQQPLTTGTAAAGTTLSTAKKTSTKHAMKATGSSRCCRVKGFVRHRCSLPPRGHQALTRRLQHSSTLQPVQGCAQPSPAERKPGLSKEPRAPWDRAGRGARRGPAQLLTAFSHQAL